jgi:putrescine aminotransferase
VAAGPDFVLHHGFTYSGHPVACAAGLATLDILARERLIARVRRKAAHFRKRVAALGSSPIVGDVRTIGFMAAVEIVRDRERRTTFAVEEKVPWRIRDAARRRGLIVRASAEAVMLAPPLVATRAEIDVIAHLLGEAIGEVAARVRAHLPVSSAAGNGKGRVGISPGTCVPDVPSPR